MPFATLNNYLSKCVSEKVIPGCVCWIGNKRKTFFFEAYGHAQIVPRAVPMQKDTVFDIASLTKPIATALSIMSLQERGMLELDNCIGEVLPSLKKSASAHNTIKQLLTHTSGLPAWYPTYLFPEERRLAHIADLNREGGEVVYSCLGYILLGKVIEQISQVSLAHFFQENISGKFSLKTLGYGPVTEKEPVATTEQGNQHERDMARQYGDVSRIRWRNDVIRGEVHDGNAYYAFSNIAGNAGLFSNAQDLATFTRAYLNDELISQKGVKMMITEYTGGEEKRGLGWKIGSYPGLLSPGTFGHTGFTGTMLMVDPQHDLIIILLANAVHPKVKLGLMNPIRERVIRMISDSLKPG